MIDATPDRGCASYEVGDVCLVAHWAVVSSVSLLLMFIAWRLTLAASSKYEYLKPSVCLRRLLLPPGA